MLIGLRIFTGLLIVAGPICFGFFLAPVWVIFPLAVIFTLSFALGRWRAWRDAAQKGATAQAIKQQGGTLAVQLVVVAMFYFVGRGVAGWLEVAQSAWPVTPALAVFAALALGVGALVVRFERDLPAHAHLMPEAKAPEATSIYDDDPEFTFVERPLSEETFWVRPCYHHYTQEPGSTERHLDESRVYLDEAQVTAEEARLGITLPDRLRRLYLSQNGGDGMDLWVKARPPMPRFLASAGYADVCPRYNSWSPLTDLTSVKVQNEAYADPETQPDSFPTGADRLFVIARDYDTALLLDYRDREAPRVGFGEMSGNDLRDGAWEQQSFVWWEDFEAFFADLKRGDLS